MCRCPQRSCWSRVGQAWLRSPDFDAARDLMMRDLLAELDSLQRRIRQVERPLDASADRHASVALLRTIPGIGPRTAEAIIAFSDDAARFANRQRYASYFGMTPTEDSSGLVKRHGHISKRGPSVVRWVLIEPPAKPSSAARRCGRITSGSPSSTFAIVFGLTRRDSSGPAVCAVNESGVSSHAYVRATVSKPFPTADGGRP